MHTVDKLEHLLKACRGQGYSIRQEWLDGAGGGVCEIRGQKWVFIDLSMTPDEQLEQLMQELEAAGESLLLRLPDQDSGLRKSA